MRLGHDFVVGSLSRAHSTSYSISITARCVTLRTAMMMISALVLKLVDKRSKRMVDRSHQWRQFADGKSAQGIVAALFLLTTNQKDADSNDVSDVWQFVECVTHICVSPNPQIAVKLSVSFRTPSMSCLKPGVCS